MASSSMRSDSGPSSPVSISGLGAGETVLGIDVRPATGELLGLGSSSRLYTIDPVTGVATARTSNAFIPALADDVAAFDVNPVNDRVRVVTANGQNLRVNPDTGLVGNTDGDAFYKPDDAHVRLGTIASLGVLAYAIGKFSSGTVADFLGGRRNILFGMLGSVAFTIAFGLSGAVPLFTIAWFGNRLAQSFVWVGMVKLTGKWFSFASYGRAMAMVIPSMEAGRRVFTHPGRDC